MFFITALIYGALAAGAALLLEILFLPGLPMEFFTFAVAASLEETMRLIFIVQWQRRIATSLRHWSKQYLYYCIFGTGFAAVETLLAHPPLGISLALGSVHVFLSLIIGSCALPFSLHLGTRRALSLLGIGLIISVSLHTMYNSIASSLQ